MAKGQLIGKCPTCGTELRRTTHEAGTGKYRYQCLNRACQERGYFNRHGERR
jgi:hypothetical protein